ncbi:MAG TPA: hypothetical protein VFL86_14815 [Burkholderiaceae bacterium]|nr:hypothetical protein [Burkholderiaceae bacterium]
MHKIPRLRGLILGLSMTLGACSGGGSTDSSAGISPSPSPAPSTRVTFMGSDKLLVGGSMSEQSASAAPFDVRYAYVHSRPASSQACYAAPKCTDSCGGWWGCWTGNTTAPGTYVTWWNDHVAQATWQGQPRPQAMLWTWYSLRDLGDLAGLGDGPGEVAAIGRADLLTRYLDDYRFFLQKIGNTGAMIDLEPDFWGYVRSIDDPHNVPAQVTAANPTDCGSHENSAAGLARCLVSMARKYAPNTGVGFHLSCFDWQTNVQKCGQDYLKFGAAEADFLVGDVADRDAGWYAVTQNKNWFWWDEQKGAEALAFYKSVTETVGKPLVLWQIPVGNMSLDDTLNRFRDDKVDYFFSHLDQVVNAHVAALLFGAGHNETTTPETDGGNLIAKTIQYRSSGGTPLR